MLGIAGAALPAAGPDLGLSPGFVMPRVRSGVRRRPACGSGPVPWVRTCTRRLAARAAHVARVRPCNSDARAAGGFGIGRSHCAAPDVVAWVGINNPDGLGRGHEQMDGSCAERGRGSGARGLSRSRLCA